MKAERLLMSISLLAVLLLFSGCGKELEDLSSPETGSGVESPDGSDQAEGEILRLQVSDAGFSDANIGSRAIDEGLTTTFEDGDQIGLFVVNNQDEILYANVPYTKDGDAWTAKEGIRTKGYPVRVFAYYPYVPDDEIIEKVDSTVDNYFDFFKTYIEGLDISNQSSLSNYYKADVMACMVEIEDKETARQPLTLTMNHLMGLVMVKLPKTVTISSVDYFLKGDEEFTWKGEENVTLPANLSDKSFNVYDVYPLEEETGYRYLCKPGDNNISFSGGFTTYDAIKSYKVSGTVSAGSSKTYNVSVASLSTAKIEYIPKLGDFYMNDGSVLSNISESNKNKCIGIVYWVPTASEPLESHSPTWLEDHSNCIHGLVVGLKEKKSQWGTLGETTNITDSQTDKIFRGYSNTQQLVNNYSSYDIVYAYSELVKGEAPLSGKTTEWYVPSAWELAKLYDAKREGKLITSLSALNATPLSQNFWSSGEFSKEKAWYTYVGTGLYSITFRDKDDNDFCSVRLVFAF